LDHPTLGFLARDLQRLRAHAASLARSIACGCAEAEDELGAFAGALRMRMRLEEELIFACLERQVADPQFAPTVELRREHRMLLALLAAVEDDLSLGRRGAAAGLLRHLVAELNTAATVVDGWQRACLEAEQRRTGGSAGATHWAYLFARSASGDETTTDQWFGSGRTQAQVSTAPTRFRLVRETGSP
jgi:hypothetical protein